MKAARVAFNDEVIINSENWEELNGKTGKIVNVLEGGINKYVVEIENGDRYLLWEHEVTKVSNLN